MAKYILPMSPKYDANGNRILSLRATDGSVAISDFTYDNQNLEKEEKGDIVEYLNISGKVDASSFY